MAGIRWPPEDAEVSHARALSTTDLFSDDDRSVAADSWSIKSDYGSNLEDEQRHVDASDSLSARDYSSDKEEPDAEVESSSLGLQSYWDATYADELANFHEHSHAGDIWFGAEVMDIIASWTKNLCIDIAQGHVHNPVDEVGSEAAEQSAKDLSGWSVLDVGTGNGLLLQELSKQGFCDLTGIDYSEGAIELARSLAARGGFTNIYFLTDDILETKLERQFQLVMDKGTLDAIGLHPDGPVKRIMYWDSVSRLVAPGGILVITSCNTTKDELVQEAENLNLRRLASFQNPEMPKDQEAQRDLTFQYVNHVDSYATFTFRGSEGSRVATVAFLLS